MDEATKTHMRVGYFSTREDMSSTMCQVGDGNLCFGGVLIIKDGWITKTHVVSRKTPENPLNRRWFNRVGYFSTREDMSSTRCQVGDENLCFGGVVIIEDGWITKTHRVGYFSTREDMSSTRCQVGDGNLCFGGVLIIEDGWITKTHGRVGYFSTREDMSSTRCQVGDGNLCFGGVLIIEDGWITKTHVVSQKTPENTVGYFSTREDMSSREEVRLEMEIYALAGSL
ncbi:hypothetical protein YC2023_033558 [Brassica napus]